MSDFFTRTLFAGASVALTIAMVGASAPVAAANVPGDVYRTMVQVDDLNLASPAGQKTLERRLNAAADAVCPAAGVFADTQCRTAAIARARAAIGQHAAGLATASAAS